MPTISASAGGLTAATEQAAHANVYYVSNNGSDGNAGTTQAAPWATVGQVNGASLSPGDDVRFNRGDTWSGTRLEPQTGNADQRITYGAYGSGARPNIQDGDGSYVVAAFSDNYFNIEDMHFSGNATYIMECDGAYVTITNVEANGGTYGINCYGTPDNITIQDSYFHDNSEQGIHIGNNSLPGPTNFIIRRNTCYNNGTNDTQHHGIYSHRTVGITIEDNESYNNAGAGIKFRESIEDATVQRNLCYGQNYGMLVDDMQVSNSNVVIKNNIFHSNNVGFYVNCNTADTVDVEFYNNTLADNGQDGADYSVGIRLTDAGNNISGCVFYNNIIVQYDATTGGGVNHPYRIDNSAYVGNNTWDNNCVIWVNNTNSYVANVSGTDYDFAGWQGLSGSPDANGINQDPSFADQANDDYHLSPGSPCIDAGRTIASVTEDYDGNSRPL